MKDLTQNKVTRINSLGLKFSALVFMAVLLTGLSITHFFTSYQQQSLQQQQQQSIARTADNYQKQFERYLLSLELKALRAQQILLRHLTERPVGTLPASEALPVNDGSWRQRDEWSGVFAPQGRPANKAQPILEASALAWQQMMPLLQQDFSSVFLMAAEQFIRVAPADWVIHVDKQLPVTTNPLYQLAAPEQNPERTLRWSPIYYDQVWESWVVAVLLPIYQQNEFLGC